MQEALLAAADLIAYTDWEMENLWCRCSRQDATVFIPVQGSPFIYFDFP